jgi:hypothetical protein
MAALYGYRNPGDLAGLEQQAPTGDFYDLNYCRCLISGVGAL